MYYNIAMIELNIPGGQLLRLSHLVCDVNGTLALDGRMVDGLFRPLNALRDRLELHLITADTHGKQAEIDHLLNLKAVRLQPGGYPGMGQTVRSECHRRELHGPTAR